MHLSKKILTVLIAVGMTITLNSCSMLKKKKESDENQVTVKKKAANPNMKERILEREGGGIFNSARINKGTTYDFATSNVMWRATLETLDFIPLTSVNYSGGLILTDWYSPKINSNESVKIEVRFLDSELKASSIKVNSFKKKCKNNNCQVTKSSKSFNSKIKNNILEKARQLKITSEQNKKK